MPGRYSALTPGPERPSERDQGKIWGMGSTFATPEKAQRYDTERYRGATGRNWWQCDPTLQFMMRYTLTADELNWAEPHLDRAGALMGGPISERADITDKHPPELIRYDRWGHEISEVRIPDSALATKRDIAENSFSRPEIRKDAAEAGVRLGPLNTAWSYMLNQAEIGMTCALGTGGDMVYALTSQFAPPDVRDLVISKFDSGEWSGEAAQMLTERTGGSDLGQLETTATPAGDHWLLNGVKWFASNANGHA